MNQATENNSGGGGTTTQKSETPATSQAQGTGEIDALKAMYPGTAAPEAAKAKEQQTQEAAPNQEAPKPGASGYKEPAPGTGTGYVDPATATANKAADPAAPAQAAPADEIKFDETGLAPEAVQLVKDFAKANGLSKEATESFAKFTKEQAKVIETYEAEQKVKVEAARAQQKQDWYNGLKSDKDFGGEQFHTNLKRVDTIVEKFFPNTINMLTKSGGILPPDIMKDLHSLHKILLGSEQMVNGGHEPSSGTDDQSFLKNFYKL
jgi:hypothetical protein